MSISSQLPSSSTSAGLAQARIRLTGHLDSYFCNPNFDSNIEAIPGTYATEADKKYEGINCGQYLVQRLAATY